MDFQSFITDNIDNYKVLLKNLGFIVKEYNKYNLSLIKYPYDKEVNTNNWEKYCRGIIVNNLTNKIVCIPPVKAKNYINFDEINNELDDNTPLIIQDLDDGTMINMFYHNNEWIISTRSDIGCNNKWENKKSFKTLFIECSNAYREGINLELLDKSHCYSFVMQHNENRNISYVNENRLILVEEYDLNTYLQVDISKYTGLDHGFQISHYHNPQNIMEYLETMKNNPYFSWKGTTIKYNNKRMNYINPLFTYVKSIKINNNNPLFNFIKLKKENKVDEYLTYFPEYKDLFTDYQEKTNKFIKDLQENYTKKNITKVIDAKDIPYQLKPLVYELHGHYLQTKDKINFQKILEYISSLDEKRLTFVIKYY